MTYAFTRRPSFSPEGKVYRLLTGAREFFNPICPLSADLRAGGPIVSRRPRASQLGMGGEDSLLTFLGPKGKVGCD